MKNLTQAACSETKQLFRSPLWCGFESFLVCFSTESDREGYAFYLMGNRWISSCFVVFSHTSGLTVVVWHHWLVFQLLQSRIKYVNKYWMNLDIILYRRSLSLKDVPQWVWGKRVKCLPKKRWVNYKFQSPSHLQLSLLITACQSLCTQSAFFLQLKSLFELITLHKR